MNCFEVRKPATTVTRHIICIACLNNTLYIDINWQQEISRRPRQFHFLLLIVNSAQRGLWTGLEWDCVDSKESDRGTNICYITCWRLEKVIRGARHTRVVEKDKMMVYYWAVLRYPPTDLLYSCCVRDRRYLERHKLYTIHPPTMVIGHNVIGLVWNILLERTRSCQCNWKMIAAQVEPLSEIKNSLGSKIQSLKRRLS